MEMSNTNTNAAETSFYTNPTAIAGKLFLDYKRSMTQATRTEPAKSVSKWILCTPVGPVCVKDIDEARELAATFKCEIML